MNLYAHDLCGRTAIRFDGRPLFSSDADLRDAVRRGAFPAPTRAAPPLHVWSLRAVLAWRRGQSRAPA